MLSLLRQKRNRWLSTERKRFSGTRITLQVPIFVPSNKIVRLSMLPMIMTCGNSTVCCAQMLWMTRFRAGSKANILSVIRDSHRIKEYLTEASAFRKLFFLLTKTLAIFFQDCELGTASLRTSIFFCHFPSRLWLMAMLKAINPQS